MSAKPSRRRPSAPVFELGAATGAADAADSRPRVLDAPATKLEFDRVYDEYVAFVWHSARRLGVAPANLEDVVQEVFIAVHRRLPTFEGRSSLRTWLYGVTLHVVRNHRRGRRRKPLDLSASAALAVDNAPLPDRHRPDRMAERRDDAELLEMALDALPDALREVLVMAELEEMSGPEIAAVTGLKPATVYGRIRAARVRLNGIAKRLLGREPGRPS
ncbi:MAG: sigma-70 family RNA polymerase sigma factor [Myxococcota bacterium]